MTASNRALTMAMFAEPVPMAKESNVYMTAYIRLFAPQHILKYRIPSSITSVLTGSNNMMTGFAKICTRMTTISVIDRFRPSPALVIFFTLSIFWAPIFCPTMAVTACPIAQQGMPASVLTFNPTPDAAATGTPKLLSMPVINR